MNDWKRAGQIKESTSVRWKKEGNDDKSVYLEVVEGTLDAIKHDVGPNKSTVYEIETEKNGRLAVWGGLTALDNGLAEVEVGQLVRIEHKGLAKTKDGKNEFRNFEVFYKDAPMKKAGVKEEEPADDGLDEDGLPPV